MFVKELSMGYYGVYADEDFTVMLGIAERIDREWYFEAKGSFGGSWAFGTTLRDAIEQTGVLEKVQLGDSGVRSYVLKGDRKCRILQ